MAKPDSLGAVSIFISQTNPWLITGLISAEGTFTASV
jgi:hypothetical protein